MVIRRYRQDYIINLCAFEYYTAGMKRFAIYIAVIALVTTNTVVQSRHWLPLDRLHPVSQSWISSTKTTNNKIDIPSWFSCLRGGSDISAEPEGVTLHGTTPSIESLYLPGLLDTSIHRTNEVSDGHVIA
jgi:hypothetical protein